MIQPILQEELFNLSDTPAGGRRDHLISKKKKKEMQDKKPKYDSLIRGRSNQKAKTHYRHT